MQEDGSTPREGFFERLFRGNSRMAREDKVREYITHRVRQGASLSDVLQEEYVRRSCTQDELDEVIQDPRLIHEERELLKRLFGSDTLDPASARRRR